MNHYLVKCTKGKLEITHIHNQKPWKTDINTSGYPNKLHDKICPRYCGKWISQRKSKHGWEMALILKLFTRFRPGNIILHNNRQHYCFTIFNAFPNIRRLSRSGSWFYEVTLLIIHKIFIRGISFVGKLTIAKSYFAISKSNVILPWNNWPKHW